MKKIFKLAAVLMTASAIICCEKKPIDTPIDPGTEKPDKEDEKEEEEEIEYTYDLEFTLVEVESVEAESATVKVKHSGHNDDTGVGFATTSTNVSLSIEDKVEELMASGDEIEGLLNGRNKTVTVTDLKPDTDYTFIAFAITKYGDVYGTYESARFRTPIKIQENAAWTVEYTGRKFIGENEYENTVTVTSTDDKPYFMTIVTKERFEGTDKETLLKEELHSFNEFIQKYNEYYEVETLFKNWCYNKTATDAFDLELGYEYVAMAIGASEDGELTGYYAYSEVFKPYEEEMTPEYAAWIGNWTFTGSNGVAFNVNIAKDRSNKTFVMTGWEGEEASHCEVIIDWYGDSWMLWTQFLYGGSDPVYGNFEVYLCPVDAKSGYRYLGDYPICVGAVTEDGKRMVGAYFEGDLTFTHMQFIAEWPDGPHPITRTRDFPHFPITVTPGSSAASAVPAVEASAVEVPVVERKAVKFCQPKRFEAYDFRKAIIR